MNKKNNNVLIVDDTPENLQVLGDMLEQAGYEVRIATSGVEALQDAAVAPPDLILLDIMMPGMDGFEVCRRLKADQGLRLIPVIFISALGMMEQKIQAFREGAVDYITKPFQAEEVVARVHTHLQLTRIEELKREIAERKKFEAEKETLNAQLLQSQKMEAIGQLAGGVAHDFNNMLTIISGYAQHALDEVDPALPLHAHLAEICKAADRSADLTHQLLAFASKQTIVPVELSLNSSISNMLKMLQRLIGEDIQLIWQPGAMLWSVRMDPAQVDQILVNLCVNARDAIGGVGNITINTENRNIDSQFCAAHVDILPGDYVLLSMSDSGCGMAKEIMARIFEPFFTTKAVGTGTGLGLATVHGIVRQNNGIIDVHSEPGQGTTFTVYLPRHEGEPGQAREKNITASLSGGDEIILLVEDEAAILKMATLMLEMQGYTVLAANTPGEALRKASGCDKEISLLITDVVMPEMNGQELARQLQILQPQLKVLFMSGYTSDVIAHHGVLDEGVNFISKPFTLPVLATKMREVLDNNR